MEATKLKTPECLVPCFSLDDKLFTALERELGAHVNLVKADLGQLEKDLDSLDGAAGIFLPFIADKTLPLVAKIAQSAACKQLRIAVVHVLTKEGTRAPVDQLKNAGANEVIHLPTDKAGLLRFATFLISSTAKESALRIATKPQQGEAVKAAEQPKIAPPPNFQLPYTIPQLDVNTVLANAKDARKANPERPASKHPHTMIFHHDETQGPTLTKIFSEAGLTDMVFAHGVEQAIEMHRLAPVDLLIFHFDSSHPKLIECIRQIYEARDIKLPMVVIYGPGEDAIAKWRTEAPDIAVDGVFVFERKKELLKTQLAPFTADPPKKSPARMLLGECRVSFAIDLPSHAKSPMTPDRLSLVTAAIERLPGGPYWSIAEKIPQLIIMGKPEEAKPLAEKILPLSEVRAGGRQMFDPLYLSLLVGISNGMAEQDLLARVGKIASFPNLTPERLLRTARLLFRAKATSALDLLCKSTSENPNLGQHHTIRYCYGLLCLLYNDIESERRALAAAVNAAPLRGEYLQSLGTCLTRAKDYRRAEDFLRLALACKDLDILTAKSHLARAIAGQRKKAEAVALLDEVLIVDPQHKIARNLKLQLES